MSAEERDWVENLINEYFLWVRPQFGAFVPMEILLFGNKTESARALRILLHSRQDKHSMEREEYRRDIFWLNRAFPEIFKSNKLKIVFLYLERRALRLNDGTPLREIWRKIGIGLMKYYKDHRIEAT